MRDTAGFGVFFSAACCCCLALMPVGGLPGDENRYAQLSISLDSTEPIDLPVDQELVVRIQVSNLDQEPTELLQVEYLVAADPAELSAGIVLSRMPEQVFARRSGMGSMWQGELARPPGTWWVGACLKQPEHDAEPPASPFVRCSEPREVRVLALDLQVTSMQIQPEVLVSGIPLVFRAAVQNAGSATSPPSRLSYVLSRNPVISAQDARFAVVDVPAIAGGESWAEPVRGRIESSIGDYWVGACVEPVAGETDRKNNCSAGVPVAVVKDEFPDLVVDSVRVRPEEWPEGGGVDFYAEVFNLGNRKSAASQVTFFLSGDADISSDDYVVGATDIPAIWPEKMAEANLYAEPQQVPGIYWLVVCAEPDETEIDTFNNCSHSVQVEVTAFSFSQ